MHTGQRIRFLARGLGIGGVSPQGFAPVIDTVLDRARELRALGVQHVAVATAYIDELNDKLVAYSRTRASPSPRSRAWT